VTESNGNVPPVIELWGQLLVSVHGELNDADATRLSGNVLDAIERIGARGLVLDLSGVSLIDSHLCRVIASLAEAATLMGVQTVLCGLTPEIVITLVTMDFELTNVHTVPTLEQALAYVGIRRVREAGEGT